MLGAIAAYLDSHSEHGSKTAAIQMAADRFGMDEREVWRIWAEYEPFYQETTRAAAQLARPQAGEPPPPYSLSPWYVWLSEVLKLDPDSPERAELLKKGPSSRDPE